MELLRRQLLSLRYIQHSARALFVVAQANPKERAPILDALFDLSRPEIVKHVQAGTLNKSALTAHDYVHDIFEGAKREEKRS
jgi:malate synthase